jgi:uncharacterized protein YceH (UPF0502 family)
VLPSEPRRGPIRRFLEYLEIDTTGQPDRALKYFGLKDDGFRYSRYSEYMHGDYRVDAQLDDDVDALRARVAELEARLAALEDAR